MTQSRRTLAKLSAMALLFLTGLAAAEEIRLDTDNGPLAGTLLVPDAPRAVALLIAGSGPTDRDGNVQGLPGKSNSLRYLAEALAEAGIASLRFDKRLIGGSATRSISEADVRFETFVDDAAQWLAYLETRLDLPRFVVGHSEGALIGLLAARGQDVAGVACLAGPGRRASDVIVEQANARMPVVMAQQIEAIVASLLDGEVVPDTPRELDALFRPSVQPYLISWFRYDPAEVMREISVPTLLVYGTTDLQVPVSDGDYLKQAKPDSRYVVIDGMNHVLKSVSGNTVRQMASYSDPELPVEPRLVSALVDFVDEQVLAAP